MPEKMPDRISEKMPDRMSKSKYIDCRHSSVSGRGSLEDMNLDDITPHAWCSRTCQKPDTHAAEARKPAYRARVQARSGQGCDCSGWSEKCGDAPGRGFRASGDISVFAWQTGSKSHTGGGALFAEGCEFHCQAVCDDDQCCSNADEGIGGCWFEIIFATVASYFDCLACSLVKA